MAKSDTLRPTAKRRSLREVTWLISRIHFKINALAERIHGESGVTAGQRALLDDLDRDGAMSIAEMARARPVARQYVQKLVKDLREREMVSFQANPQHARSKLVVLTTRGELFLRDARQAESHFERLVEEGLDAEALAVARDTLQKIHQSLTDLAVET